MTTGLELKLRAHSALQAEIEALRASELPWGGIILIRDKQQARALQQLLLATPSLGFLSTAVIMGAQRDSERTVSSLST